MLYSLGMPNRFLTSFTVPTSPVFWDAQLVVQSKQCRFQTRRHLLDVVRYFHRRLAVNRVQLDNHIQCLAGLRATARRSAEIVGQKRANAERAYAKEVIQVSAHTVRHSRTGRALTGKPKFIALLLQLQHLVCLQRVRVDDHLFAVVDAHGLVDGLRLGRVHERVARILAKAFPPPRALGIRRKVLSADRINYWNEFG